MVDEYGKNNFDEEDIINCYGIIKAIIAVTDSCPYKGGKFLFEFHFHKDYPFLPPSINMITKIYHPNFKGSGELIIHNDKPRLLFDEISKYWTPIVWTLKILDIIHSALINPSIEPDNIINEECAHLISNDKNEYEKIAKEWTEKYAI